jgi:hypothetical protein
MKTTEEPTASADVVETKKVKKPTSRQFTISLNTLVWPLVTILLCLLSFYAGATFQDRRNISERANFGHGRFLKGGPFGSGDPQLKQSVQSGTSTTTQ